MTIARHLARASLLATLALTAVIPPAITPPATAGPLRDRLAARMAPGGEAARKIDPASLPTGSRVLANQHYGEDAAETYDVYLPPAPRNAPILFMVHGGGWAHGDKAMSRVVTNKVNHWPPKGYVLVSINYPMLPQADPLAQADAVARAVAQVQQAAPGWGGDPARMVLMGHSAGAHLVSLVSADPGYAAKAGARPWLGTVALDSAAFDVVAIMEQRHFKLYDTAFGTDPAFGRAASPDHQLSGKPAPMLLVCSSKRADSCAQARRFTQAMTARGASARVLPVALSHGDINGTLGADSAYTRDVDAFLGGLGLP